MYKRYVLFDFDGTLFDTSPGILRFMRTVLERNGYDWHSEKWLHRFIGPPVIDALKEYCGMDDAEAERVKSEYREMYRAEGVYECSPMKGAKECLESIKQAGARTAVATSKPYYFAEQLLELYDFRKYFDVVCGAESDAHSGKAEIVERALVQLDADRSDSVMVGDRKYDILGAKACGIPCIAFDSGFAEEGEYEQAGAILTVKDFAQLTGVLLAKG